MTMQTGNESKHHRDFGPRLLAGLLLNSLIPVVQIAGGVIANSLGLISDAIHNLSDVIALGLGYAAERVGRRPATVRHTYAFKRAEIIAAFINAALLIGISVYIGAEAVKRLLSPEPVLGLIVMIAAGAGLIVNVLSAFLLHRHEGNLNVRAAFLHLVGDAVTSLGVMVGGLLVYLLGWYWVDPALSVAVAGWMSWEAVKLIRGTLAILMEGVPEGLDPDAIEKEILHMPGVRGVHDLHVWAISSRDFALSAHVVVDESRVRDLADVLGPLKKRLWFRFGIGHATFEPESTAGLCVGGSCSVPGRPGPCGSQ